MKSAKEMFEELGYSLVEDSPNLKYQKVVADTFWVIYFDVVFQYVTSALIRGEYNTYHILDVEELKAINKQIEELGWLEWEDIRSGWTERL